MKKKYAVIRLDKYPAMDIEPNHFKIISMFPEHFNTRTGAQLFIESSNEDVVLSIIEIFVKG